MAIRWRDRVILAKLETVYGTDPTPTGGANALLLKDVSLQPMEGQNLDRELLQPYFGNSGKLSGTYWAVMSGTSELAGSGTAGTAPAWGPLAQASAFAQAIVASTSVTYTRVTNGLSSITIYFWRGGTLHKMLGCRGTGTLTLSAEGIPQIRWTLTGLFVDPEAVAQQVPTFTAWKKPLVVTKPNTPLFEIDDVAFIMRKFELDFGNDVQRRSLINYVGVEIVEIAEKIDFTIESVPLATFNPFSKAKTKTPIKLKLTHGTAAGNICTVNAPICELDLPGGLEEQQGIEEMPLKASPLPNTGNDQLSIVLT